MSAPKSHLTPAEVFGRRVREARERRGWNQREAAERLAVDRTTLNKIEMGSRGDVSISQLFTFANVLGIAPVHLLTPRADDLDVEITRGGPVMSPSDARRWIRGALPEGADPLEWLLDLPRDEQREHLRRLSEQEHGVHDLLTSNLAHDWIERDVAQGLEMLDRQAAKTTKDARAARQKGEPDG
jgi:transcriptional regulator with XRE-family HTH domain